MITRLPDVLEWLAAGVPLTLLIDLLDEAGPDSRQIYREEPGELGWLPSPSAA